MKSLVKQFKKLTTKSKNYPPNSEIANDDNTSETSSEALTTEVNTQYSPKTKERINRLIQNISQSPDALDSILTKLETGNFSFFGGQGLTKLVGKDLAGKRYDIFTAAGLLYTSFGTKGMLPGLLRNGLLTELASIDQADAATILNKITDHNLFKENLRLLGINDATMPTSQMKGVVNSFVGLINIINQSNPQKLESLGISIADLVENNQKIEKLQEKLERNKSKLESSHNKEQYNAKITSIQNDISHLETSKSVTNIKIINNIISNLESEEYRPYITSFTLSAASFLAKSLDNLDISEEKSVALEAIQKYNEQIKKLEEEKQDATNITNERDSLIKKDKITIFEQLTYFTRKTIQLKPDKKLDELLSLAEPTISAVFSHPIEIANISAALQTFAENPKQQLSNLVFNAMSLLKHDDVLSALIDPEKIITINKSMGSDKVNLANKFIEIFTADSAIDNIMGDKGLGNILPRVADLQKVQQFLNLSPQDVDQFKALVPDLVNYLKSATHAAITHPEEITAIASAFQSYSDAKDKAEKIPELVASAAKLLNQPDVINTVFDNSMAIKALDLQKIQEVLKISPQDLEQFKAIVPDAVNYLKSATQAALTHPEEITAIALAFQSYSDAKDKAEKIPELVASATKLLNQPDVIESLSNEKNIDNLISNASKIPRMREYFNHLKKDLSPLKAAIKDATPKLIGLLKEGIKSEDNKKILIKAEALLHAPIDKIKFKALAIEAIDLYSKNPLILKSVVKEISKSRQDISKIIDESLSSIKKDSYLLRLLKPLGINGDFVTSMLEKTINEKGLEALKKFTDHPSGINAIHIISATGNLSSVISHAFKNGFNYLIGKTSNKESISSNLGTANTIPIEESTWTKKVMSKGVESQKSRGSSQRV